LIESKENAFVLVLMDLQMPVMDGYVATGLIRQNLSGDQLPIVAMTAESMNGTRQSTQEHSMNDYILKPIVPELLYKTLIKWIEPKPLDKEMLTKTSEITDEYQLTFESLEHINVEKGLLHLNGNKELYVRLLDKFYHNNLTLIDDLKVNFEKHEYEEAHRVTHTIKGISGSIGAEKLHKTAEKLDNAVRKNEENLVMDLLYAFQTELDLVLNSIKEMVRPDVHQVEVKTNVLGTTDELKEILEKLLPEVEEHDLTESKKLIKLLVDKQWTSDFAGDVKKIIHQVKTYEFDIAIDLIIELQDKL